MVAVQPKPTKAKTPKKPVAKDAQQKTLKGGPTPANPSDGETEYERQRVAEVRARARLYVLRAKRLEAAVLDRKLLMADMPAVMDAIRGIILASKLSQSEKADILENIALIPSVIENAAAKQIKETKAGETVQMPTNGHDDPEL